MSSTLSSASTVTVRPYQRRDLDELERLAKEQAEANEADPEAAQHQWQQINRWYGILKLLNLFPNPLQHLFSAYVAEQDGKICGIIQVSPFNRTRTTWKVEQVLVNPNGLSESNQKLSMDIGSLLLRHCFQTIWEARTWIIEVNINDKDTLALYRHNGFQPLAHMTYWSIEPDLLSALAEREPDLPNLLPVSNADAGLLHQLDTVSMPPLVRQVFDRHVIDFKTSLAKSAIETIRQRVDKCEITQGYVFESQRKAAIGFYRVELNRKGTQPHTAQLTVHPAYTWLYPELLAQMAQISQVAPEQTLSLASSDYQPEREEYLERIGATRTEHTLLMSRSVWHKLRETKPVSLEGLQLSEVLQGLQPARKPVPGRFSWLESVGRLSSVKGHNDVQRFNLTSDMSALHPSEPTDTDSSTDT